MVKSWNAPPPPPLHKPHDQMEPNLTEISESINRMFSEVINVYVL